jgi:hypothetical protein
MRRNALYTTGMPVKESDRFCLRLGIRVVQRRGRKQSALAIQSLLFRKSPHLFRRQRAPDLKSVCPISARSRLPLRQSLLSEMICGAPRGRETSGLWQHSPKCLRRISRCQSRGNASGFRRPKVPAEWSIDYHRDPIATKDSAHPSASRANDTDVRQSVRAPIGASMGKSISGGMNVEGRRIRCWRISMCAGGSSLAAAGRAAKVPMTSPWACRDSQCGKRAPGLRAACR